MNADLEGSALLWLRLGFRGPEPCCGGSCNTGSHGIIQEITAGNAARSCGLAQLFQHFRIFVLVLHRQITSKFTVTIWLAPGFNR